MAMITAVTAGQREELTTLELLTEQKTVVVAKAKPRKIYNPFPTWTEDQLSIGDSDAAAAEGSTLAANATQTRGTMSNVAQIFKQEPAVSGTLEVGKIASGYANESKAEFAIQVEKARRQNTNNLDAAAISGSKSTTSPRKMDGLLTVVATPHKIVQGATENVYQTLARGVNLMVNAGSAPDMIVCNGDFQQKIADSNRSDTPYQTIVVANSDGRVKGLQGGVVPVLIGAETLEVYNDPRVPAKKALILDSNCLYMDYLRENARYPITNIDGVGIALITEACIHLSHSKAGVRVTIT